MTLIYREGQKLQQQVVDAMTQGLHKACQQSPPDETTVRALAWACPTAVRTRDAEDRWLPLHRACRRRPSGGVVQCLIQSFPESVTEWTADGATESRLPLHLACQYGAPLAVVVYLVQQRPETLHAVSSPHQRYTALDYALYHYHQSRQAGLDVTDAERVVQYLAHHSAQQEHDAHYQHKKNDAWRANEEKLTKETEITLPYVRAHPIAKETPIVTPVAYYCRPKEVDDNDKPRARTTPTSAPPRPAPWSVVPKSKPSSSSSGRKSKIIRMKLPKPSVPLRDLR